MVAVLPSGHPLTAKQVLGHRELRDEVLVSLSRADDPPLHDRILEAIESAGYRFRGVHEVGGADTRDLLRPSRRTWVLRSHRHRSPSWLRTVSAWRVHSTLRRRIPQMVVAWRTNPRRWPQKVLETVRGVARELATHDGIDQAMIEIGRSGRAGR